MTSKFFRVIWEQSDLNPELILRVNRQLSTATQRNRVKRLAREYFRLHQDLIKKGRWVLIAKRRAERGKNYEIFDDLHKLFGTNGARRL